MSTESTFESDGRLSANKLRLSLVVGFTHLDMWIS